MRHGGDSRGSSYARRARKHALLALFGNGERCTCAHCGRELTYSTLEQDRIEPGGRYVLANLQPSCGPCNKRRSNNPSWRFTVPTPSRALAA